MFLKTAAAASVLVLAAGMAHATDTVSFTGLGLSAISPLTPTSSTGTGFILQTGSNGQGAAPFLSGGADKGEYLSVLGGGSATIEFAAPKTEYNLYVGSLDNYNTIAFIGGPTYTGDALLAITGGTAISGNQSSALTNGLFKFSFDTPVSGIVLSSSTNSLEVGAVPEPATWAVMLLGFGGIGASMRSARRKQAAATA